MKILAFLCLIFFSSLKAATQFDEQTRILTISSELKSTSFNIHDYKRAFEVINQIDNIDDKKTALSIVLKNYPKPSIEQILTAAFKIKDEALLIISRKNMADCYLKLKELEEKIAEKDKINQDKCIVCHFYKNEDPDDYTLTLGKWVPDEITIGYSGLNDQPLHGAIEQLHNTGNDLSGHTYGSKINVDASYPWGNLTFDIATDLYVTPYSTTINGKTYYYTDGSPEKKFMQEGVEHTSFKLGSKFYLDKKLEYHDNDISSAPYLKLGIGYEIDSDQGIGKMGAISHREWWHHTNGARENSYVNHFKDDKYFSARAGIGEEVYLPLGKLGLCATIESGLTAKTNSGINADGSIKAKIDSGTFGGFTRENPLFVINLELGANLPIKESRSVKKEDDSVYSFLKSHETRMFDNQFTSYFSVGVETGGKNLRLGVDAVYEKSRLNDGDLIFVTSLKYKF